MEGKGSHTKGGERKVSSAFLTPVEPPWPTREYHLSQQPLLPNCFANHLLGLEETLLPLLNGSHSGSGGKYWQMDMNPKYIWSRERLGTGPRRIPKESLSTRGKVGRLHKMETLECS